jgi:primosomal protein N' (replication factor Y)
MQHFVNIALPLPAPRLFTYVVPESLLYTPSQVQETLQNTLPTKNQQLQTKNQALTRLVGCRALVPFGKRVLTGVIVEVENVAVMPDAKPVLEFLEQTPAFSPMMLAFAKWIADYYLASLGETLKIMLPQGMSPESIVRVSSVKRPSEEELETMRRRAPRRYALVQELLKHDGEISVGYLEKVLGGNTSISAQLEILEEEGFLERHRGMTKEIQAKTARAVALHPSLQDEDALRNAMDALDRDAPKQSSLLGRVWLHYQTQGVTPLLAKDALAGMTESVLKGLVQKEYAIEFQTDAPRIEKHNPELSSVLAPKDEAAATLTLEQQHACDKISEALEARKFKTFLLHGVTGSGKTLVYMNAIRETLERGKTALLLVPEIALTPQLIERFRAVFGTKIGVMHSHKSAGERFDAWRLARSGDVRIVIGARSALFVPLPNVGIIIVDEEHEPSYKQDDPAPRYNARDCAVVRGTLENAVVVLGSATPSLETMFNARSGKYHLLEITERADGATMPQVRVVDVLQRRKQGKMYGAFSEDLLKAVLERVVKKEGVILFQNRRGFASRLECRDCGHVPMCPNCSVPLTYHKYRDALRCHYCGHSHEAEKACTHCGSVEVREIGSGTQRIEEDLQAELKNSLETFLAVHNLAEKAREIVIQRMDLDTTTKKGAHAQMLTRFAKGDIDILLGTQMVAKGLDFARVTLVGVINADMQMYLPDFRAAERTFQLLTQVSGRAGRSSDFHGEVILQTAHPKHQTIVAATAASYEMFYNDELQARKEALYPPFVRFVMIEFSGKEEPVVHAQAQHFAFALPQQHHAFLRLGPAVPSIARLRGNYRRIIVLKNLRDHDPTGRLMREALLHAYHIYNQKHASSAVKITIDVDAAGFV